ncbi:DUF89 family protein, partial [Candidatus Bathyarchaeota archaeon]|nr:DUF89 family protein [Candidatus Bathyarchaeota archaeon]
MKLDLKCLPCFLTQALKTMNVASETMTRVEKKNVLNAVMDILKEKSTLGDLPAITGRKVYMLLGKMLNDDDVYADIKRESNESAKLLLPRLRKLTKESDKPLKTAASIAILGNLIDLGAHLEYDLEEELDNLRLAIDHFPWLIEELDHTDQLLYLGDNAGEIFFDRIFIEALQDAYDFTITFAVRGGPIINDATMEDAREAGLSNLCRVIESTRSPGVILSEANDEFLEAYQ